MRCFVFLMVFAAVAHAQQPACDDDDPRCTQVTVVPPANPPPTSQPPPQQLMLPAPGTALGDGWILTRDANGLMFRERTTRHRLHGVWISGLSVFTAFWIIDGALSAADGRDLGSLHGIAFLPVIGSFVAAGRAAGHCGNTYCDSDTVMEASYAVYGVIQAAGLAMLIAGASIKKSHIERQPVLIVPGVMHSGAGVTATVRF